MSACRKAQAFNLCTNCSANAHQIWQTLPYLTQTEAATKTPITALTPHRQPHNSQTTGKPLIILIWSLQRLEAHLVVAEDLGLQQQLVHKCGLAVIDVGNDGNVPQVLALGQAILSRGRGGCMCVCVFTLLMRGLLAFTDSVIASGRARMRCML